MEGTTCVCVVWVEHPAKLEGCLKPRNPVVCRCGCTSTPGCDEAKTEETMLEETTGRLRTTFG